MTPTDNLLRDLLDEEARLQFDSFGNDVAFELGLSLREEAQREALPITIDITRSQQQLFHCALPGTSLDNDEWIQRKNRVVYRFGHSSFYMGVYCKSRNATLSEKYALDPHIYTAAGGAFPIVLKGTGVIGTVTVSGLPQEEDHRLVVRVLERFLMQRPDPG